MNVAHAQNIKSIFYFHHSVTSRLYVCTCSFDIYIHLIYIQNAVQHNCSNIILPHLIEHRVPYQRYVRAHASEKERMKKTEMGFNLMNFSNLATVSAIIIITTAV